MDNDKTSGGAVRPSDRKKVAALLASVFIIAICGILYELLISTISSYFQGSSVLHFSIVIGLFLSFMGVGSFFSKYIKSDLAAWFIRFELVLSLVGGCSAFFLYFAFSLTPYYYGVAFTLIAILGAMIGIEIPILTRIVRQYGTLKDVLANVLSFDYLGALIASLAFPLLLLPLFGTMRTAFAIGLLNLVVAYLNTRLFREELRRFQAFILTEVLIGCLLIAGFAFSFQINSFYEHFLYRDEVVLSKQSSYQNIVLTRWNKDIRLFLNGNLQFASVDEHRYHEALVHVPMNATTHREKVLVLGGGDGLAAREILKYQDVVRIDIVDLDAAVTDLAKNHPVFRQLNQQSFDHPKIHVINEDAYKFVEKSSDVYNVVIIDLPDPSSESLAKLYTKEFYQLIQKRLAADGVVVSQSTSVYFAPDAYWCIHNTLQTVLPATIAYHAYVPTFGDWGFNLALNASVPSLQDNSHKETAIELYKSQLVKTLQLQIENFDQDQPLKYLNKNIIPSLFEFAEDRKARITPINQLQSPSVLKLYEKNWNEIR